MKTENISVGFVGNNYKHMCTLLNEDVKSGKAKKLQLARWACYFEHVRQGNKFIIKEIYGIPKELPRGGNFTHGLSKHRIYGIWGGMKDRCYNEKCIYYKHYGGRGIKICDEWLDNFMNFYNWAQENGYDEVLSIDRINVDGIYEPSNCRWATMKEQANNKRNSKKYKEVKIHSNEKVNKEYIKYLETHLISNGLRNVIDKYKLLQYR